MKLRTNDVVSDDQLLDFYIQLLNPLPKSQNRMHRVQMMNKGTAYLLKQS